MPLSRHAQEEVDRQLEQMFKAFFEGAKSDGLIGSFGKFLEKFHPNLFFYYEEWYDRRPPE